MRIGIILSALLVSGCSIAAEPSRSNARVALPFPRGTDAREGARGNFETICGKTDDSQDVERYLEKPTGPDRPFVDLHEPSTAQIRWKEDLISQFPAPDDPGDVQGVGWCTGTLIAKDLLLTAAHCFSVDGGGWVTPSRGGKKLQPEELARLMEVVFNFQLNGVSMQPRPGVKYQVAKLEEFGFTRKKVQGEALDYAILRLQPDADKRLPGDRYRFAKLNSSAKARDGATLLTVIQHPAGRPKKIDAGKDIVAPRDLLIRYGDLDSRGASSGSGVLDQNGELIGVHTNGGCSEWGGFNYGVSLHAINQASDIVK